MRLIPFAVSHRFGRLLRAASGSSTVGSAVTGCAFFLRRLLGNALRRLRRWADHAADRVDPAFGVELMARVQAQYAADKAAQAASVAVATEIPKAAAESAHEPLACAACMHVLVAAVHLAGTVDETRLTTALGWIGHGPTITTAAGERCGFHATGGLIQ